ncbi:MAG: hypothetical protein OQK13_04630, partial [Gammaproteobacteria bacterium]|nr:hypothetical protein [Gammaproteobacteria bacterium]
MRAVLFTSLFLFIGCGYAADAPEFDFSFDDATQPEGAPANENIEVDFNFDEQTAAEENQGGIPLRGKVSFDLGYQFDSPQRWQTIGPAAQLIFDWSGDAGQFYSEVTTRYNHAYSLEADSQPIIDKYRINNSVRELYWKRAFGEYSLTVGRAIVAWGKADLLPVIDVISPSDSSNLLFAKPEELRLGQDLIKFDWYRGNSELNLIYTPKARYNLITDYGHPYSMMLPFVSDALEDSENEWAVRWTTIDDKLEYGIIAGDLSQRDPLVVGTELTYAKSNMIGGNIIYSRAPFLWKGEFLYVKDSPHQRPDYSGYEHIDTLKGTIGFDFASTQYGTWIVEYSGALTRSEPPMPLLGGSTGVIGISWMDSYLRDDLSLNAAVMLIGGTGN